MNAHYASQGRQPEFPHVATPDLNPDADFRFMDHGQTIEPNAQHALSMPTGAPTIIRIGDNATRTQQNQMNQQTVQAWNAQQHQQQPNVVQP
eukprot:4639164-Amphidinium_carterae.1